MDDHSNGPSREDRDEYLELSVSNGRRIGYARYGAAQSPHPTTIYLHGYPSSRLEAAIVSQKLLAADLQLISIDRPGLGRSTPSSIPFDERTILHYAEDVRLVADHLGLERFVVMGYSGGAPSAFACAHLMPERIMGLAIVAGFGPYEFAMNKQVWRKLWWLNKLGLTLPVHHPKFYSRIYNIVVPFTVRRISDSSYEKEINSFSFRHFAAKTEDGKLILEGGKEFYDDGIRNVQEAVLQHNFTQTHVEEARMLAKPWPFKLEDIRTENVRLFYGTKDINVPVEVGEMIRDAMGERAVLRKIEGGTHSTVVMHAVQWIKEVLNLEDVEMDEDGIDGKANK